MRKKVLFFIGILLLCLVGWGFFLYNKPHTGVTDIKPDITIGADELYKEYNDNETTADKKFLNKVIAVTGAVDEITKTDTTYAILLKKEADMGGVSCNLFTTANEPVQHGKMITIKGRCTGFLLDVALTDCVIEKP